MQCPPKKFALLPSLTFHNDNAPSDRATTVQTTVRQLGFELLSHPPYSPDLSPCDFLLFPVMKTYIRRIHFSDTHEHSASVQVAISNIQLNSLRCSVESGLKRCRKCTSFNGECFELNWALLADHAQENDSQTAKSPYWIISKRRGTVEPQWLEHLRDHGNSFETWGV